MAVLGSAAIQVEAAPAKILRRLNPALLNGLPGVRAVAAPLSRRSDMIIGWLVSGSREASAISSASRWVDSHRR